MFGVSNLKCLAATNVFKVNTALLSTSSCVYKQKYKYPKSEDEISRLQVFQHVTSSDTDRRVYVWGLAEHGALGNQLQSKHRDKPQHFKHRPIRLHFAEQHRISDITCGYGFTAFAVNTKDEHKVFGCGINTDSQIGYHAPRRDHPLDILLTPSPIEIPFANPATTRVTHLSAGRAHLAVLTNDEGVFLLGNNSYGQCGRRIIDDEKYSGSQIVHNIPNVDGVRIKNVECGQDHTMLLTETGEVYAFGWGADGQTGLGHYESESSPHRVLGDVSGEPIVKLSCAADCVLALSSNGDVFGWGNSEYNQLPVDGDNQQINVSRHVTSCRHLGPVADIASGGSFCSVLTAAGDVHVWGYGILGQGPRVDRSVEPTLIPGTLFGRNEFSPGVRVAGVAAGLSHQAAVTDAGDVYVWGRNRGGCLGLGHDRDQYFPLRVALGAVAVKVCLGVDHSAAICKPFV